MSRLARTLGPLALAGVALLGGCADPMATPDASTAPVRTVHLAAPATLSGRYLVSFRGAEPADFATTVAGLGATIERRLPSVRAAILRNVNAAAATALGARADLEGIAGDVGAQMIPAPVATQRLSYAGSGAPRASGTDQSGAFFFPLQWNIRQIAADQAWGTTPGGQGKLVCVLDTGIDPDHLDLTGRVDPSLITSFVTDTSFPGNQDGIDYNAHGTSTAAYIVSNGFGVASVAPDARLCSAKVLGVTGFGSYLDMVAAIVWATETAHADVINLSLGGYFNQDLPGAVPLLNVIQRAMDQATQRGTVIVAAGGNMGINLDEDAKRFLFIPAQLRNVISVGATAPYNQQNFDWLASYSNHGGRTGIDLVAPGGDFLVGGTLTDLVLSACSQYQVTLPFACTSVDYLFSAGTSEAAPHVSGAVAVVESSKGTAIGPTGLTKCILQNTDPVGPTNIFGAGRLNVLKAAGC